MIHALLNVRLPAVLLLGCLAGWPLSAAGQITFRNIDPKRLGYVPLQKPIQPSKPYLPKPGLQQEIIRPNRMQFDMIPKDNITFQDLRQPRIEQAPIVAENLREPTIAPQWSRRTIIGPRRMKPQPLETRQSFRFESPMFLPATRLHPGMDDSMKLTPSLFDDRPPEGTPTGAGRPPLRGFGGGGASGSGGLGVSGTPRSPQGRPYLGW